MALGDLAEVHHGNRLQGIQPPELTEVAGQGHAGLDDVGRRQQLGQGAGKIQPRQLPQIHPARRGDLHQAGQVVLALVEGRAGFGVEAHHGFLADVGHGGGQLVLAGHHHHFPFVTADRQARQLLVVDRAPVLRRQDTHAGKRWRR